MEYEQVLLHISNSDERLDTRYLYPLSGMTREQLIEYLDDSVKDWAKNHKKSGYSGRGFRLTKRWGYIKN